MTSSSVINRLYKSIVNSIAATTEDIERANAALEALEQGKDPSIALVELKSIHQLIEGRESARSQLDSRALDKTEEYTQRVRLSVEEDIAQEKKRITGAKRIIALGLLLLAIWPTGLYWFITKLNFSAMNEVVLVGTMLAPFILVLLGARSHQLSVKMVHVLRGHILMITYIDMCIEVGRTSPETQDLLKGALSRFSEMSYLNDALPSGADFIPFHKASSGI